MKSYGYLNNAKGAVAPLVAIMLVVIIVCVAVVVDLGHIHNVKIQLQRAVDAAALTGARALPDEAAAVNAAVAVALANNVDQEGVVVDPVNVVFGLWDKESLGESADDRFDDELGAGEVPNAVKVTATRNVDHIFFFFVDSTTVTADAIAVYKFVEETIPIALVSCIPTGGASLNIASPGLSVCDITTYEFNSDNEDTAAWTSLTFSPASNPLIQQFLTEEGRTLFNEVVYGTNNNSHDGIENTDVYTGTRILPVPDVGTYASGGCLSNAGTSISCGLGEDISLDPESIDDIRKVDPTKLEDPAAAEADPLAYEPLPRWYHFDEPSGSYHYLKDAFTRIWTQDGHLVADSAAALQSKLADLFFEVVQPYGVADHRFKSFIECQGACSNPSNRYSYNYKPLFNEVLRYTGYPPVWVNNGAIPPSLATFLDRIVNDDDTFKSSVSTDNEPFESGNESNSGGRGHTVELTLPVIFAGDCEEWKALATGPPTNSLNLYYVGTANFLLTRAWKNPDCFEHANNLLTVTNWTHNDGACDPSDFEPPLAAGDSFQCVGGPGSNPSAALEGMIRPPTRGDEATAGIRRIYLVE
jgi:hypothetical protein